MSNPIIVNIATPVVNLEPGEVCMVFRAGDDGATLLYHNIASVEENNELSAENGDAGLFIMAMTMNEVMETDEPAFLAAMKRVVTKMQGHSLKLVK